MEIKNYVAATITRNTSAISQEGFGTLLILTTETLPNFDADTVRAYSTIGAVEADADVDTSTAAYKAAAAAFASNPAPAKVKIAVAEVPVAGVGNLVFTAAFEAGASASVTVNGTAVTESFATDDATTLTALATAIAAVDGIASAVADTGTHTIAITGVLGHGLTVTNITVTGNGAPTGAWTETTVAVAFADSMPEIIQADNDWYGLMIADVKTDANILNLCAWAESGDKIFMGLNSSAGVLTASGGNVLATGKAKKYTRSAYFWSNDTAAHPEAAWMAQELAENIGAVTWKYKSLAGVTPDTLTDTEYQNIVTNNGNCYTTTAGQNMTEPGVMLSGDPIDVITSIDWLNARITEAVFALLKSAKKIPYTNKGVALLENAIRGVLEQAKSQGILADDEDYTITVGKVADQTPENRSNRVFPDLNWSAILAGAIEKAVVNGAVAV